MHVELFELERRSEARLHIDPLLELAIHDGAEILEVVATAVLGLIHGGIRVAQQRSNIVTVTWEQAEADTHRSDERLAGNNQRHVETRKDTRCSFVGLFEGS